MSSFTMKDPSNKENPFAWIMEGVEIPQIIGDPAHFIDVTLGDALNKWINEFGGSMIDLYDQWRAGTEPAELLIFVEDEIDRWILDQVTTAKELEERYKVMPRTLRKAMDENRATWVYRQVNPGATYLISKRSAHRILSNPKTHPSTKHLK